jgi:hypothetical protein
MFELPPENLGLLEPWQWMSLLLWGGYLWAGLIWKVIKEIPDVCTKYRHAFPREAGIGPKSEPIKPFPSIPRMPRSTEAKDDDFPA